MNIIQEEAEKRYPYKAPENPNNGFMLMQRIAFTDGAVWMQSLKGSEAPQTEKDVWDEIISQTPASPQQGTEKEMRWVKASEPPKDNETYVTIIEQRGNGSISQKPAYSRWNGVEWVTEENWKVFEWLKELSPLPTADKTAEEI